MLEGKVGDFSLPEIFQLIALTKKTGTLRVTTPEQIGHVRFRDGEVSEAAADVRRLALGARLVATGLVDESQLAAALEAKRDNGGEVLRLLLQHAAIDEGALHAFVREQIADAVADMLRFDEASFRFDTDENPSEPLIDVQVATDQLVTEGNQRLAEWDAIREHVPSRDTVFAVVPVPPISGGEVAVDAEAWQILALVDGHRPVHEIVDLSGRSEFSTSKALAGLASRKLVEPCGDDDEGGPLSSLLARREVLRRLEELELSELPTGPPQPAPATEHSEPQPASEDRPDEQQDAPGVDDEPTEAGPLGGETAVVEKDAPGAPADSGDDAVPPAPSFDKPPLVDEPQPAADSGEGRDTPVPHAAIDRAQVARELASLGLDDVPSNGVAVGHAGGEDAPAVEEEAEQGSDSRRLVRDEEINRGLLLRLIDGVKGA